MKPKTGLAVVISCIVWFVYIRWFAPPPPKPVVPQNQTAEKPAVTAIAPQQPTVGTLGSPLFNGQVALDEAAALDLAKLFLKFSSNGGKPAEITLKEYKEKVSRDAPQIALVSPSLSSYSLGTIFTDAQLSEFSFGRYELKRERDGTVELIKQNGGLSVTKQYRVGSDYMIDATYRIQFPNTQKNDWGALSIPVGASTVEFDQNDPLKSWEVVFSQNDSVSRHTADKLPEQEKIFQGNTQWLSFGNRYFSAVLINESEINPDIVLVKEKNFAGAYLRYPLKAKPGQILNIKQKIFAGPKDYNELSKLKGLTALIDYGTFSFLAYPLLLLLKFFYTYFHNYGVAIILLTLVVRGLFYPLSLKSYRSMKSMQKLQPQIAALKEKYKDDKEKLSREQIALFKTHKVNPAGGCVPMLIQLPVFIALYAVLANSIELFHAPFFGWIHDLSSKDPYYVYPILMGVSMLLQQKLTPSVGMDPMQVKMMYIMPVVFTFIMLNLPSGLTMYIFVSTILGVLQQWAMTKEPHRDTAAVVSAKPTPEKG
ncbi:MAG: membrane protein insertase YidC [Deltaproteobacteria bacterium]|nr:membrane protein insertase YidC [Deltaproteobacteria bacterium]